MWFKEIGEIIKKDFGDSYPFTTVEGKYCMIKMLAFFSSDMKRVAKIWGV